MRPQDVTELCRPRGRLDLLQVDGRRIPSDALIRGPVDERPVEDAVTERLGHVGPVIPKPGLREDVMVFDLLLAHEGRVDRLVLVEIARAALEEQADDGAVERPLIRRRLPQNRGIEAESRARRPAAPLRFASGETRRCPSPPGNSAGSRRSVRRWSTRTSAGAFREPRRLRAPVRRARRRARRGG